MTEIGDAMERVRNGGWQPIETAPKDGRHILWNSADGGSYCVIYWPIYSECFEEGYWQPLPAPHAAQRDMTAKSVMTE